MENEKIQNNMKKFEKYNSIIHCFMGYKLSGEYCYILKKGIGFKLISSLRYHKDWNLLMKVVEKIESLNYRVTITFSNCFIDTYNEKDDENFEQIALSNSDTKFYAVFDAVIQFINYYNNLNKYV